MASTEDRKRIQSSRNTLTAPFAKALLLVSVVLLVPVILLVVRGESFASTLSAWKENPPPPQMLFAAIVAILALDVFLPVPSGPVSTLAGSQLGWLAGSAASTLGMTGGAIVAFALAKTWGRPLVERLTSAEQLQQLHATCRNHGAWMLLLTRPAPVVAEAAVLLLGSLRMPWRQFLPLVTLSNLLLSGSYAALGATAARQGWLPAAICCSVAVPFLASWWWKRRYEAPRA